jgi:hypothetical protein
MREEDLVHRFTYHASRITPQVRVATFPIARAVASVELT